MIISKELSHLQQWSLCLKNIALTITLMHEFKNAKKKFCRRHSISTHKSALLEKEIDKYYLYTMGGFTQLSKTKTRES